MRRYRTMVVEDELPARQYLVELLARHPSIQLSAAVRSIAEANSVLEGQDGLELDLAFVDIQLEGDSSQQSGLDWVRSQAKLSGRPLFVLTTAHAQHALEAYQLGVADYLLKPISESRVAECLERIEQRSPAPSPPGPVRLAARSRAGLVFFPLEEVLAFEAEQRIVYAHTLKGRFDLDLSLTALEKQVGVNYMRVHRSWLVNLLKVDGLEKSELGPAIKIGSLEIPIARDRQAEVRKRLLSDTLGLK